MIIRGKWHPPGSAAQIPAALYLNDERFKLEAENGACIHGGVSDIEITDRLGHVERKIRFQEGSVFATSDNDSVDDLFKQHIRVSSFFHYLESHLSWVAFALLGIVIFVISFLKWGVPWTSDKIARALPHETNVIIAANTLKFLDQYIFEESTLDLAEIQSIQEHFRSELIPLDKANQSIQYTLHFRDWREGESSIPNALALPSGDIILTDEFVRLCETQAEMDAALLHEMGHVVHRHGLEMVIEATLVSTAIVLVMGNPSGIADLGVSLGALLVSAHYSRNHEIEADHYAYEKMLAANIDPAAFSKILARITKNEIAIERVDDAQASSKKSMGDEVRYYISTHPSTGGRIQQAKRYSKCYQQGLLNCESMKN